MKHLLLILLCFLSPVARADDSITSLTWNSVTGTFQALTRALGWKQIPDYNATSYSLVCGTDCTSFTTYSTGYLVRVGKQVTLCLQVVFNASTIAGPVTLGGLPSEFRPLRDSFQVVNANIGGWKATTIRIRTTGDIWVYGDTTLANFPSSGTFSTNSGDQACATYTIQ